MPGITGRDEFPRGRRWPLVLSGLTGLAALVLAWGWFFWLPGYRPALRPGERYGIDVASYQGRIDWRAVARAGIGFAYIKATEGVSYVDPRFASDWAGARAARLPHGAYHYFSLCDPGAAQATAFLRTLPPGPALPPAVDVELAGNCPARPPAGVVARQLRAFVAAVGRRTRQPVVVYLGGDFAARYPHAVPTGQPLWLRHLLVRPAGRWLIWQVDGQAHVAGVHGDVDLDVMRAGAGSLGRNTAGAATR